MFREAAELMGVARIGERQHEAADVRLLQRGEDVRERHVGIVRRFRIAPAHMQADALARDVRERRVDGRDHLLDETDERGDRLVLVGDVALEREVGRVDLQQKAACRTIASYST